MEVAYMSAFPRSFRAWYDEKLRWKENFNAAIADKKFNLFIKNLMCASKVTLAFVFILNTREDEKLTELHAHENSTLLE